MMKPTFDPIIFKPMFRRYILLRVIIIGFIWFTSTFIAAFLWENQVELSFHRACTNTIGYLIGVLVLAKPYLAHVQIVISDKYITGPARWNRVTFLLNELDKTKNIQQKQVNKFWNGYHIYSQKGEKIDFEYFLFDKSQITQLENILEDSLVVS